MKQMFILISNSSKLSILAYHYARPLEGGVVKIHVCSLDDDKHYSQSGVIGSFVIWTLPARFQSSCRNFPSLLTE